MLIVVLFWDSPTIVIPLFTQLMASFTKAITGFARDGPRATYCMGMGVSSETLQFIVIVIRPFSNAFRVKGDWI